MPKIAPRIWKDIWNKNAEVVPKTLDLGNLLMMDGFTIGEDTMLMAAI